MASPNAPKPRTRPLAPSGRASTHTTSLSPAQAAWVRSRPEGASAYLRGLVDSAMDEAIQTGQYRPLAAANDAKKD